MSNQYPEPPKLTSAKKLMHQPVEPKTPKETDALVKSASPRSMFPTMPETPAQVIPAQPSEEEVADLSTETTLEPKENNEDSVVIIDSTETSETDVALGQVESPSEGYMKEIETSEPNENDPYGPWGIIKHTGYVAVALWAVFTAAMTGAVAYFFTPHTGSPATWITLAVLGFMTGVIAAVDRKTHLIKNQHTIATAIVTVPLAVWSGITLGGWNILFGLLASVVVFGVFIFLVIKANFGSGGDIKFSPVPAFALGVVNPLISALWLFYALIITVILLMVRKQKSTSFGEGMAISLPFAIFSVYALYSMTGLTYMDPATL